MPVEFITSFHSGGKLDLGPIRTGPWSNTMSEGRNAIQMKKRIRPCYFPGRGRMPAFSAMRTRSATDWAPIFFMIDARWTLMVFSAVSSLSAIFLFGRPVMTQDKDLVLLRREGADPRLEFLQFLTLCLLLPASINGPVDGVEQVLLVEGLLEEVQGACLHGAHAHRDRAVAGDKDDGQLDARHGQFILQLETADFRHPHIENQASRFLPVTGLQKLRGGGKGFCREAHGLNEPLQGPPDGRIVVDDENDRLYVLHGLTPLSKGTVKENVAPLSGLFTARISPLWDLTISLLMARPMPIPPDLVV